MSLVSRRLADAAKSVIVSSDGILFVNDDPPSPLCTALDSPLVLSWAPHVRGLWLCEEWCNQTGITFLQLAKKLRSLSLPCHRPLSGARANYILPFCNQVTRLSLDGAFIPSRFPSALRELFVSLRGTHGADSWEMQLPNALIYTLAHVKGLRRLSITLHHEDVELTCPVLLSPLDVLYIQFPFCDNSDRNLDWLQRQPCRELKLDILIHTISLESHQQLIAVLQKLQISTLKLSLCRHLPRSVQALWQAVRVEKQCTVDLTPGYSEHVRVLHALPRCPRLVVESTSSQKKVSIQVHWAALVDQAADIRISMYTGSELHILAGCDLPAWLLPLRWQLEVWSASHVHGFEHAHRQGKHWYMQSPGAIAAGWSAV